MNAVKNIINALKEVDLETNEKYTAAEWIEAVDLIDELKAPAVLQIPFCVYDLKLDEHGQVVLQKEFDEYGNRRNLKKFDEDGNKRDPDAEEEIDPKWHPGPVRIFRYDVFIILAWIAARRDDPGITREQVRDAMTEEVLQKIHDDVFWIWGIDMSALRKIQAEREETTSGGEPAESDGEYVDPLVLVSNSRPEESAER